MNYTYTDNPQPIALAARLFLYLRRLPYKCVTLGKHLLLLYSVSFKKETFLIVVNVKDQLKIFLVMEVAIP